MTEQAPPYWWIFERCHDTKGAPLVKVACSIDRRVALTVYETEAVPLAEARWRGRKQDDGKVGKAAIFWPLCDVEPEGMFSIYFPLSPSPVPSSSSSGTCSPTPPHASLT